MQDAMPSPNPWHDIKVLFSGSKGSYSAYRGGAMCSVSRPSKHASWQVTFYGNPTTRNKPHFDPVHGCTVVDCTAPTITLSQTFKTRLEAAHAGCDAYIQDNLLTPH